MMMTGGLKMRRARFNPRPRITTKLPLRFENRRKIFSSPLGGALSVLLLKNKAKLMDPARYHADP
jgi:hypothetical protein